MIILLILIEVIFEIKHSQLKTSMEEQKLPNSPPMDNKEQEE